MRGPNTFWNKVKRTTTCWIWTASCTSDGYGRFKIGGRMYRAHRFIWERYHGPIPPGLLICHKCDNRACVRLNHLFLGTPQDNIADRDAKNRTARGEAHGRGPAKLHPYQIRKIKSLYKTGRYTQAQLGNLFNVAQTTISNVVTQQSWAHV